MKIRNESIIVLAITLFLSAANADTTVTYTGLGISAYLPDNWISTPTSDTGVTFTDTTYAYRSQIICKMHPINTTDFPSAGDWTRAHFMAYLLIVHYSYDPFGAILYFDSSAASTQDSLWAPEAFSEFYSLDTMLNAWNEFMRYTESGNRGYEIYVIGDTTDMKLNIGMYLGIIRLLQINHETMNLPSFVRHTLPHNSLGIMKTPIVSGTFDLLGKKRYSSRNLLNGIYCRSETRSLQHIIK